MWPINVIHQWVAVTVSATEMLRCNLSYDSFNRQHELLVLVHHKQKGDMLDLIETYYPDSDIICETENWLSKDHKDGEICIGFLDRYDLFRRNRSDRQEGGGVLIAAKKDLQAQLQTELETQCESVKMWLSCRIAEPYPYTPQCRYSRRLELDNPDMDWPTKTVTWHTKRRLHEDFIDLIDDYSLKQLVDTPTRQGNILDLVLTNASEHCNECTTIPGISDHEAVRVTSTFGTKRWFTLLTPSSVVVCHHSYAGSRRHSTDMSSF